MQGQGRYCRGSWVVEFLQPTRLVKDLPLLTLLLVQLCQLRGKARPSITTLETLLTEEDKSPISNIKYDLLSALYCFIMEWRVMTGAGRSHTVQSWVSVTCDLSRLGAVRLIDCKQNACIFQLLEKYSSSQPSQCQPLPPSPPVLSLTFSAQSGLTRLVRPYFHWTCTATAVLWCPCLPEQRNSWQLAVITIKEKSLLQMLPLYPH